MRKFLVWPRWRRPSGASLGIMAAALMGAGVAMLPPAYRQRAESSADRPSTSRDIRFTRLGRAYLPELGRVYAAAWYEGARRLEDGQSMASAIGAVGKAWDAGRIRLFDRLVTPEFAAIVPQVPPQSRDRLSVADREVLARAWRAFAAGLEAPVR